MSPAAHGTKRRVPQDFFSPSSRKRVSSHTLDNNASGKEQYALDIKDSVPGLRVIPDFISVAEEQTLLRYLNGSACHWRTDLSRRTMHFGGDYCLYTPPLKGVKEVKPTVIAAPPLPDDLTWLVDKLIAAHVYEAIHNKRPEYVIVNEYINKLGISAHTENFSFESPVVGLSLGSADTMRFHELSEAFGGSVRSGQAAKAPRTGRLVDVPLPGRSLCIMSDDSRWKWQHEIRPVKRKAGFKRVSLTFRVKKSS